MIGCMRTGLGGPGVKWSVRVWRGREGGEDDVGEGGVGLVGVRVVPASSPVLRILLGFVVRLLVLETAVDTSR